MILRLEATKTFIQFWKRPGKHFEKKLLLGVSCIEHSLCQHSLFRHSLTTSPIAPSKLENEPLSWQNAHSMVLRTAYASLFTDGPCDDCAGYNWTASGMLQKQFEAISRLRMLGKECSKGIHVHRP